MPSPPIKVVYLAPRPPALSPAEFRPRWRAFGTLAMGLPLWENIARYDQCDPVTAPLDTLRIPTAAGHGGVGMIWFRSVAHLERLATFSDLEIMREAEIDLFGALNDGELLTSEHLVVDRGPVGVELVVFLQRAGGLARGALAARLPASAPAALDGPGATDVTRCVLDLVAEPDDGPDVVVELGFEDAESLDRTLAAHPGVEALLGLETESIDASCSTAALVRRTTLFDAGEGVVA